MKEKFAHILDLIIKPKGNISVDGFILGKCSDKILKKFLLMQVCQMMGQNSLLLKIKLERL